MDSVLPLLLLKKASSLVESNFLRKEYLQQFEIRLQTGSSQIS